MQIPLGKLGPRQVLAANGLSEPEGSVDSLRVLKIRVFLIIKNRLLRDVLARLLRRQENVELSWKSGSGETNPEEVAKSGCDIALLDFLDPDWLLIVREQCREAGRAIKLV
jgi:hypothetical protein